VPRFNWVIAVTDTHFVVRQAVDSKVFPKLSVREIVATELALPVTVGIHLVNHDGAVQASITSKVSLADRRRDGGRPCGDDQQEFAERLSGRSRAAVECQMGRPSPKASRPILPS
jgi:hypothetical protein